MIHIAKCNEFAFYCYINAILIRLKRVILQRQTKILTHSLLITIQGSNRREFTKIWLVIR